MRDRIPKHRLLLSAAHNAAVRQELVGYQKCENELNGLEDCGVRSVSSSVCGEPLASVGQ